jgi:hypothetical protein
MSTSTSAPHLANGHAEPPPGLLPPAPRVSVTEAARRHPWLVLLPILLGTALGIAYGLAREPIHRAQARLTVGRIDLTAPGALAGFTQASQSLAAGYARAIEADGVVVPTARRVGLTETEVLDRVRASPVPDSPVIRVEGRGADAEEAQDLANAAAASLVRYVRDLNRENPDAAALQRSLRREAREAEVARQRLAAARKAAAGDQRASTDDRLAAAIARRDIAQAQYEGVREAYLATLRSGATSSLLQVLAPARRATDDRRAKLQLLALGGALAGAILGLTLATLLVNRRVRRRLA